MLSFGYNRLKQTGENYIDSKTGKLQKSRKKTSHKWFETQDTIGYWEDFFKPKIMYQEMVQEPCFMYDENQLICLDTGRIITGDKILKILPVLNSRLFFFAVKKFYGGGGLGNKGVRMKHTFFNKFPFIEVEGISNDENIYSLYNISKEEIKIIEK